MSITSSLFRLARSATAALPDLREASADIKRAGKDLQHIGTQVNAFVRKADTSEVKKQLGLIKDQANEIVKEGGRQLGKVQGILNHINHDKAKSLTRQMNRAIVDGEYYRAMDAFRQGALLRHPKNKPFDSPLHAAAGLVHDSSHPYAAGLTGALMNLRGPKGGPDFNAVDLAGDTALIHALKIGNLGFIKTLRDHVVAHPETAIDLGIKDLHGRSAVDIAKEASGNKLLLPMLLNLQEIAQAKVAA